MNRLFLGAGPANIFSILYLLYYGCRDKIVLVDSGNSPIIRGDKELLNGFMGAGLFSDGKMVFSDHPDTLTEYNLVTSEKRHKIWSFIKQIINDFLPDVEVKKSLPASKELIKNTIRSMEIRQSETWHIGTANNKIFGQKIWDYLVNNGIEIWMNTEVTNIDFNVKTVFTDLGWTLKYDVLQIGLGKIGSNFIKKVLPKFPTSNSCNILPGNYNIGGRFETPYNNRIREIVEKVQYDFKFYKSYTLPKDINIELRTFCVNNESAYVVQENFNGRIQYNGHAIGTKESINNLTNFGILATIPSQTIFESFDKSNRYIVGPNFNFNSTIQLEGIQHVGFDTLNPLATIFEDFIECLNKELDIDGNYMFFLPEIKENPGILNVSDNFELPNLPNVKWVGDSCVGTRGIVPAIVSGISPYLLP